MARKKGLVPIRCEIAATAGKLFEMAGLSPEKCSKDQREVLAAFAFGFALTPHEEKFEQLGEVEALGDVSALATGLLLDVFRFSLKEAAELTFPLVDASAPLSTNRAINLVIQRGVTAYGQWQDGRIDLVRKNLKEILETVKTFPRPEHQPEALFSTDPKYSLRETREKLYAKHLGKLWEVNREIVEHKPQVDVYVLDPECDEIPYKMVTGGMSDYPMKVPEGVPFRRTELVLYVKKPKPFYYDLLRHLAHIPHDQEMWYAHGTSMPNGPSDDEARPIFEGSELDCFLFLDSIVEEDENLHEKLVLEGDPVNLLWVIPITSVECRFANRRSKDGDSWMGLREFLDILERKHHPVVLEEMRKSYVRRKLK